MHIELFEQSDRGGPAYDIKEVPTLLVRFGANHPAAASLRPSRRRRVRHVRNRFLFSRRPC